MTNREYWLGHRFSRFDSMWMIGAGCAIGSGHMLTAFVVVVIGSLLSGTLEAWAK